MMREVLERRFARLEKEDPDRTGGEWPDLLLIDGGKGQLSAVCEMLEDAGRPRRAGGRRRQGAGPQRRARGVPSARRARDDPAAQFARCCSTSSGCATRRTASPSARTAQKRAKSLTTSTLDEVPGIGPNRKRALLMHFGTARAVKGAALEDLERAPGISKAMARQIYDYFHPRG